MASKTVSVCIPTYNRPEFLLKAIRSCLSQTYQDYEIIISDNSDNDITEKMIQELNHPAIKYHKNEQNIGSFSNFVQLIDMASGTYIKYLMDDDLLKSRCLEKMVKIMEDYPSVGIVTAPLEIVDNQDKRIYPVFYGIKKMHYLYAYQKKSCLIKNSKILKDFLTRIYPCCVPTGLMYRKECFERLGTFENESKFANDVEICMRFALEYDFFYIHEVLSSWRYSVESDTVRLHDKGLNNEVFYQLSEKYLSDTRVKRMYSRENWKKIIRKSYLFASKRCFLNIAAGFKHFKIRMILDSIKIIFQYDKHIINKILLPFLILGEVLDALMSWIRKPVIQ